MTEPQAAASDCEHHYEAHIVGGHPLQVIICSLCRTPDWNDLAEQAAALRTPLEKRLRLAHQARRAKEHQLDGIRRALCDVGFMEDDDPYSHADLEDVIRQAGLALSDPTAAEATKPARLLDCGFCYEEQCEEVHPHPECPVDAGADKRSSPVVGTARIALDVAMEHSGWAATESNVSARHNLFSLACQDMPVEPSEVTEAIKAADMELATSIKSYADGRRSSHGELWYDAILEMAGYIANLPPVVAP